MKPETLLWVIVAAVGLGVAAWLMLGPPRQAALEFQQGESGCNPGWSEDVVTLTPEVGKIQFAGAIVTSVPCVALKASLEQAGRTFTLTIISTILDKPCTDCIGRTGYTGEISRLRPGLYTVTVFHNSKLVSSQEVTVR